MSHYSLVKESLVFFIMRFRPHIDTHFVSPCNGARAHQPSVWHRWLIPAQTDHTTNRKQGDVHKRCREKEWSIDKTAQPNAKRQASQNQLEGIV